MVRTVKNKIRKLKKKKSIITENYIGKREDYPNILAITFSKVFFSTKLITINPKNMTNPTKCLKNQIQIQNSELNRQI